MIATMMIAAMIQPSTYRHPAFCKTHDRTSTPVPQAIGRRRGCPGRLNGHCQFSVTAATAVTTAAPPVYPLYRAGLSRCAIRARLKRTAFRFARPDSSAGTGSPRYRRWSAHAAQPTSEPTRTTTQIQPTAHPFPATLE